jgi:hypothetical protein
MGEGAAGFAVPAGADAAAASVDAALSAADSAAAAQDVLGTGIGASEAGQAADSLAGFGPDAFVTDSLAGFDPALSDAADSVAAAAGHIADPLAGLGMPADTLQVGAEQIFGPLSQLLGPVCHANSSAMADTLISGNIVFKLVVLLCFGIYCLSLYSYRSQALTVLNIFRSKLYVDNLLRERNYTFDTFLNIVIFQGVLGVGLAAVKAMDIFYWQQITAALPGWGMPLIVVAVVLVVWIVIFLQSLVLVSAGALTDNRKFIFRLRYLRRIDFALFSLVFTPLLLMAAMAPAATIIPIALVLAAGVAFIVVFHLVRTYMMFIDENFSKLYWFLYLCAVEIFPVTFLALFFGKFFA